VISVNTFSKSWLMTGFRLGWIVMPEELIEDIGKLIEYNTSCAPPFVQRAGIAAVDRGEPIVVHNRVSLAAVSRFSSGALDADPRNRGDDSAGRHVCILSRRGLTDSLNFCKKLVTEAGLGLAPGISFGEEGEGFVRCALRQARSAWPKVLPDCSALWVPCNFTGSMVTAIHCIHMAVHQTKAQSMQGT
jgi:aspartate/methionine/tyrosine aminotransferase